METALHLSCLSSACEKKLCLSSDAVKFAGLFLSTYSLQTYFLVIYWLKNRAVENKAGHCCGK